MKILHCIAQLPNRTGSGIYYRSLISQIDQQENWKQAGIFGLNERHLAPWLQLNKEYSVQFETHNLPFPIVGMSDEMPYDSTKYSDMTDDMMEKWKRAFISKLMEAKEEFNPEIIICHHLWILCSLVLEVFPDTPIIGISHGTDIRQAKQNPAIAREHVGSLRGLTKVLALSKSDIEDISTLFDIEKNQILVTGGAYNHSVFYPGRNKKEQYNKPKVNIVYAGKIADSKGVFELVEAYAKARQHYSEMSLHLFGKESDETRERIGKLSNHDPTIRLFDVVSQEVLANHMRSSDIFVFASYYEGLGLIALEALASGLHLVSNTLPGLREQLGEELCCEPIISWVELPELENFDEILESERDAYVEKLRDAILNQVYKITTNCEDICFPHDKIKDHTWESLAKRIMIILEDLI
ncbi:MAG: glycosyltransferase family 4 protein [Tissierellia bacterium]|nr:glycosyltransferase family 4 protein [Tissierellia bacterium]